MIRKLILPSWIIAVFALLLYSFTQVDLSLTLSRSSVFQSLQQIFQQIGYFNRSLSTLVFLIIFAGLFSLYTLTLNLVRKKIIERKTVWKIVIALSIILFFAYNAFSYDLFNYIFDVKIVTFYGLNPYEHKALDFPQDPMLSFLHSTHRTYPYGPSFLLFTAPLSFIGLNIFIITFYLFKLLFAISYLGSVYFIQKIQKLVGFKDEIFGTVLFALSPIVLIEGLVSGHNDLLMMFLALSAFYFLFIKKQVIAFVLLLLSIGIKFSTLLLLPVFAYVLLKQYTKKDFDSKQILFVSYLLMVLSLVITSLASGPNKNPEIQPWYFLNVLAFLPFIRNKILIVVTIIVSTASLLSYLPYLSSGSWPVDIVSIKNNITLGSLTLGVLAGILFNRYASD